MAQMEQLTRRWWWHSWIIGIALVYASASLSWIADGRTPFPGTAEMPWWSNAVFYGWLAVGAAMLLRRGWCWMPTGSFGGRFAPPESMTMTGFMTIVVAAAAGASPSAMLAGLHAHGFAGQALPGLYCPFAGCVAASWWWSVAKSRWSLCFAGALLFASWIVGLAVGTALSTM